MARRRRRRNRLPRKGRILGAVIAAAGCVTMVLSSCRTSVEPPRFDRPPLVAVPRAEPVMRVRIATAQRSVRIDAPHPVTIKVLGAARNELARTFTTPLTVGRQGDQFVLQSPGAQPLGWKVAAITIAPGEPDTLSLNGTRYPGTIVIHAVTDSANVAALDAVNHVGLESYLPGVIERELYSHWHSQAFVAQAIAARSYAISQAARTQRRHYDLESSTASQMYGGSARNSRAIEAVAQTRGVVLMWQGKVLPAYYSSSCGGTGQDAAIAFPNQADIPPLRAVHHGPYCKASPSYRWGPITQDRVALSKRFAAWGKSNGMSIGNIRTIERITIAKRNAVDRPTQFRIDDSAGKSYTLGPEHFRFACNYTGPGAPPLANGAALKSAHVTVQVSGRNVVFTDGRGHGHGVGLCQYGTQALAQEFNAVSILNFYYPHAKLERIY